MKRVTWLYQIVLCLATSERMTLFILKLYSHVHRGVYWTMPIYEYQCLSCKKEFQNLVLKKEEEETLLCPECSGRDIKRLISRVVYHVSESDRLAAFDPNAQKNDSFYKDSRNIGLAAQKRAEQMGVDLGKGFSEKLEKLRTDPGSVFNDSE